MNNALYRIIDYPHAPVFDKDPKQELALRVRHPNGLLLEVDTDVLRLTRPDGFDEYPLADYSISHLADRLTSDGYDVVYENTSMGGQSAHVLLNSRADQDQSNGDHLYGYTSLLWCLAGGYSREIDAAGVQVGEALRQMVITQAEADWLDVWAGLYGVPRLPSESDADLQQRIPAEVFRPRVNGLAIEQAINDLTGETVEIREPWKRMFVLDGSRLSDTHALHDADYFTYHIIHPVSKTPIIDWTDVLQVINRNRAAGVTVYAPAVEVPPSLIDVAATADYLVWMLSETTYTMGNWRGGEVPLGVMRLDDNEFSLNHPMMAYQLQTYSNADGAQTVQTVGVPRNVAYAAITLSDGVPLGDENAILSRGQVVIEYNPSPTVSDELAMSDYDASRLTQRVERVILSSLGEAVEWQFVTVAEAGRDDVRFMTASAYDGMNAWSGPWDGRNWLGWREVGSRKESGPMAFGAAAYTGDPMGEMRLSDHEFILNHPMVMTSTPA